MATSPLLNTKPTTNYLSSSFTPTLSTTLPTQQAQTTPTTTQPIAPITSPTTGTTNSTLQGYTNPNVNYFQQPSTFQPALTTQTPQQQTPVPQTQTASMGADPNAALTQKYTSGFQQAQATGQQAPQTTGTGSAMVNSYTGGPTPTPMINPVDTMMAEDKGFQKLMEDYKTYQDTESQRTSLVDEYKKLQTEAGLPELNAEAINMKNVIEGTEDDIRNEITKAGGFATESQVLALTGARNKGLIKNYNKLIDTINNAQSNVNTMIGLTKDDRAYAQDKFKTQMEFDKQIIEYRDKMQTNAKDAYNKIINNVGYAGLLQATKGDPYQVNLIEKTLGLQSGQLQQLANYTPPQSEEDKLDLQLKRSQLLTDEYQRANIESQINERGQQAPINTLNGKEQTADQSKAQSFAERMAQSNTLISSLASKMSSNIGGSLPTWLQSGDRQSYEAAKSNFITAILRRESGAAISPSEFTQAEGVYFPKLGESQKVIEQKADARNLAINNLYREANIQRPALPGDVIEADGKRYTVGINGELTEVK